MPSRLDVLEAMIFVTVLGIFICGFCRPKTQKSQPADPVKQKNAQVFSDRTDFLRARLAWVRDKQLFENIEAVRLAKLEKRLKGRPISIIGCFGYFITLGLTALFSSSAFWGVTFIGLILLVVTVQAETKFNRVRHAEHIKRREYPDAEPVYQQQAQQPPKDPSLRKQPNMDSSKQPVNELGPVKSMRQAYSILGLPPGRITIQEAKAAYRKLQSEHHPDKVSHLGKEMQELAAIKSLQLNLAMSSSRRTKVKPK